MEAEQPLPAERPPISLHTESPAWPRCSHTSSSRAAQSQLRMCGRALVPRWNGAVRCPVQAASSRLALHVSLRRRVLLALRGREVLQIRASSSPLSSNHGGVRCCLQCCDTCNPGGAGRLLPVRERTRTRPGFQRRRKCSFFCFCFPSEL